MTEFGQVVGPRMVRIERLIAAPPARVWAYITESEKRRKWLAAGEIEPRVGGRVEMTWRNWELAGENDPAPEKYAERTEYSMVGEVLEYDPPHALAYTWPQGGQMTEVRFALSVEGGKTRLVLTHANLPSRGHMVGVSSGWHTHLGHLVALAEGRPTGAFWSLFKRVEAEYEKRIPADA